MSRYPTITEIEVKWQILWSSFCRDDKAGKVDYHIISVL